MGICRCSFKNSSESILMCPSPKLRNRHDSYPGSSHVATLKSYSLLPLPTPPEVPPPESCFVSFPCFNNLLAWRGFELYVNEIYCTYYSVTSSFQYYDSEVHGVRVHFHRCFIFHCLNTIHFFLFIFFFCPNQKIYFK